jgi:hypothetical protein
MAERDIIRYRAYLPNYDRQVNEIMARKREYILFAPVFDLPAEKKTQIPLVKPELLLPTKPRQVVHVEILQPRKLTQLIQTPSAPAVNVDEIGQIDLFADFDFPDPIVEDELDHDSQKGLGIRLDDIISEELAVSQKVHSHYFDDNVTQRKD